MIKEFDDCWMDENNNTWDKTHYTKEEATMRSKTLINCHNCHNCNNCNHCNYCLACHNCDNCGYCSDCSNCFDCNYCSNCSNCSNCSKCSDCKENPRQYITAKIGRRKSATHFYWTNKDDVRVVCGCFWGNLEAFEKAVLKTHENNKTHREAYLKEIEKVKFLIS